MSNGARPSSSSSAAIEADLHYYQSRISAVRSLIVNFEAITGNTSQPRDNESAMPESQQDTKSDPDPMATTQKTNEDGVVQHKEEVKENLTRRLVVSQLLYGLGYPFTRPPTAEEVAQEEKRKLAASVTSKSAVVEGKDSAAGEQVHVGNIGVERNSPATVSRYGTSTSSKTVYNADGAADDVSTTVSHTAQDHGNKASVTTTTPEMSAQSNTASSKPGAATWNGITVFNDEDDTTDEEEVETSAYAKASFEVRGDECRE
jgi:hypothetical protein